MHISKFTAGCLLFLAACQPNTQAPESKAPTAIPPNAVTAHFQFSQDEMQRGTLLEGNWCQGSFQEAVPIFPDASDYNLRLFNLPDGVYKIFINAGASTASFFLRRAGERPLEVFTGTQFPLCLSGKKYHTLVEDGSKLEFDNKDNGVHFSLSSTPAGPATRMKLSFPAGAGYGLTVHRCADCR